MSCGTSPKLTSYQRAGLSKTFEIPNKTIDKREVLHEDTSFDIPKLSSLGEIGRSYQRYAVIYHDALGM